MGQANIMTILASFGPLQSKEIALGACVLCVTVSRSLQGLARSGEVSAMRGHGRKGGSLVFWAVAR